MEQRPWYVLTITRDSIEIESVPSVAATSVGTFSVDTNLVAGVSSKSAFIIICNINMRV